MTKGEGWRIPDERWVKMEALLPPRQPHPLGCHNRHAMNAIVCVLRTGGQWKALNSTGICSGSSAHRRFRAGTEAGVFLAFWLNRFRRIPIRWEKRAESYLAMLHLACGIIIWCATGLLG